MREARALHSPLFGSGYVTLFSAEPLCVFRSACAGTFNTYNLFVRNFALIRERNKANTNKQKDRRGTVWRWRWRWRGELAKNYRRCCPGYSGKSRQPGYANATVSPAGLSTDVFSIRDSNKFNLVRSFVTYSLARSFSISFSLSLSMPLRFRSPPPFPLTPFYTPISLVSFLFRRSLPLIRAVSNPFAIVGNLKERSCLMPIGVLYWRYLWFIYLSNL